MATRKPAKKTKSAKKSKKATKAKRAPKTVAPELETTEVEHPDAGIPEEMDYFDEGGDL